MAGFTKVIIYGNLTRDPELRVTPRGTSICQFGVAVSRQFRDESQQLREEVNFFDIEAWGKTGENISKFFTKGRPILIDGRLRFDQWDDKTTGQKRSRVKIVAETFQFVGPRENAGGGGTAPQGGNDEFEQASPVERHTPPPRPPRVPPPPPPAPPAGDNIDEDVPF